MPQQESDAESPLPSTLGPSDAQPAFLADSYLHDLKQLPELRPIAWKPGKAVPEINNRREKVAACLVATRGVVADKPCTNCARGKGPMANCVSLAPWIHSSCANCHFHGQGYQCSFRSGGAREKDEPSPRLRSPLPMSSKRRADPEVHRERERGDDPDIFRKRDEAIARALGITPRKRQRLNEEEASKHPTVILQSPESSSEEDTQPTKGEPTARGSGFRARRGKSSSGMRNSLGRRESSGTTGVVPTTTTTEPSRRSTLPGHGSTKTAEVLQSNPALAAMFAQAAKAPPYTSSPYTNGTPATTATINSVPPKSNGVPVPIISNGVSATTGKGNPTAVIDTLSKAQQRQMYMILSGIKGSIDQLQKEFKAFQNLLGVDIEDD